jgi:hypothetical protein
MLANHATRNLSDTYDAIDRVDLALMRAFALVAHLRKERHPLARQLSTALNQAKKHQFAIVEAAIDTPLAAEPVSHPATVLHLVPRIDVDRN